MKSIIQQARACTLCAQHLPHPPRPILAASSTSRILIIGQAPGARVHLSGVPWEDASGNTLRKWLGVDSSQFYAPQHFALLPMGFCYPGKGQHGDLPPRPECAPLWHPKLLPLMPNLQLTLLIGRYAQNYYLGSASAKTLTENIRNYRAFLPRFFLLPHPSPLNRRWLARNPWFESDHLPHLKQLVDHALTA